MISQKSFGVNNGNPTKFKYFKYLQFITIFLIALSVILEYFTFTHRKKSSVSILGQFIAIVSTTSSSTHPTHAAYDIGGCGLECHTHRNVGARMLCHVARPWVNTRACDSKGACRSVVPGATQGCREAAHSSGVGQRGLASVRRPMCRRSMPMIYL